LGRRAEDARAALPVATGVGVRRVPRHRPRLRPRRRAHQRGRPHRRCADARRLADALLVRRLRVVGSPAANMTPALRARVRRTLIPAIAVVAALGVAAEVVYARWPSARLRPIVAFFSLSYEENLPTWLSSMILFACALALFAIAHRRPPMVRRWTALAWIF